MSDPTTRSVESDEERDARFAPLNDAAWGKGNWVRCPKCPRDHFDREVYHHRDAHRGRVGEVDE